MKMAEEEMIKCPKCGHRFVDEISIEFREIVLFIIVIWLVVTIGYWLLVIGYNSR